MKVATIIARTIAGWHTIAAGEDISAIKKQFKEAKVTGLLKVGDLDADCIVYFDTAGGIRRKKLADPETSQLVGGLNDPESDDGDAATAIIDEANRRAKETAQKIVQVVAAAITPLSQEKGVYVSKEDVEQFKVELDRVHALASERQKEIEALRIQLDLATKQAVKETAETAAPVVSEPASDTPAAVAPAVAETTPVTAASPTGESGATAPTSGDETESAAQHFGGTTGRKSKKAAAQS